MDGAEEQAASNSIDSVAPREAKEDYLPRGAVDWGRSVTTFIVEHPELCLGIALAFGVAIGVVVKRR